MLLDKTDGTKNLGMEQQNLSLLFTQVVTGVLTQLSGRYLPQLMIVLPMPASMMTKCRDAQRTLLSRHLVDTEFSRNEKLAQCTCIDLEA